MFRTHDSGNSLGMLKGLCRLVDDFGLPGFVPRIDQRCVRCQQACCGAEGAGVGAVALLSRRVAVERTVAVNTAACLVETPPAISDM